MAKASTALPNVWLPELVELFARYLDPRFVVCTLRMVDKATAEQFRGRPEFSLHLSQPVPPQAFAAHWGPPGAIRDLTLAQRHQLLRLTAASGVVANLEVALGAAGCIPQRPQHEQNLGAAAAKGCTDAVRYLLALGGSRAEAIDYFLNVAAKAGHQGVCEVLLSHERSGGVRQEHVTNALRGGHPQLADWLLQQCWKAPIGPAVSLAPLGISGCISVLHAAAEGCSLVTLQSLYGRCRGVAVGGVAKILSAAAGSRTADWQAKVEWWEPKMPPEARHQQDTGVCQAAAACPDAEERLAWLLDRGYLADKDAASRALEANNAAALELLLQRGLRPEPGSVAYAAGAGCLEALKTLLEHGCPLDAAGVARAAAEGGQLRVLVWAVEQLGASVQDPPVVDAAVRGCDLEALRWLRQHGCPLDGAWLALSAAQRGQLAVLAWAAEELGASLQSAALMDAAAASGRKEVMAWLRERGCPWGTGAFALATGAGCEAALEWLVEQGCPMPAHGGPYYEAACNVDLSTLRCLARLGCPWGLANGGGAAFAMCTQPYCSPSLPVLRLLLELGCPVNWEACRGRAQHLPADVRGWLLAEADAARGVA
ncbi:hypothetical protein GPECTOR_10g1140 [Gonium pectorale]|uniref:Uncharacterized protein n=1 Tax=Gonium pectorale TaxID=33097 RepID=A0A150GQJ6_GONPE|nr:hypothetical protein GPECTOR_10g1140 [Gonium pectorale]|eukprot:KXZ52117.1 hypothetical protein GPECTOR_10g1140 [Gonium pectorale]